MKASWFMLSLVLICATQSTAYFGWNLTPETDSEFITDLLILIFAALAYIAGLLERLQKEAA